MHLGNCDIGCDVNARNTLDLNYLPLAEKHGAEVRPLHLVTAISREGADYRVSYNRIESPNLVLGSATARIVIVGCRVARIDRTVAALPRSDWIAAGHQQSARHRMEQQRRFSDAGDSPVPRRQAVARTDDHGGNQYA